jgi:hypothetical protein
MILVGVLIHCFEFKKHRLNYYKEKRNYEHMITNTLLENSLSDRGNAYFFWLMNLKAK